MVARSVEVSPRLHRECPKSLKFLILYNYLKYDLVNNLVTIVNAETKVFMEALYADAHISKIE